VHGRTPFLKQIVGQLAKGEMNGGQLQKCPGILAFSRWPTNADGMLKSQFDIGEG
jgi:hypothetical protein